METSKEKKNRLMREWRKKNPDRAKQLKKNHINKHREKYLERSRDGQYRRRYGITLADYNLMLLSQNNKCAICGCESGEGRKKLVVDHCHVTLKVRKLLCQSCNSVIGMSNESINILQSSINYLSSFGSES